MLMDQDGNILDSSVKNRREEERNLYALADKMAEGQETHVWAALADGERIRFAYEGGPRPVLWLCGAHRQHSRKSHRPPNLLRRRPGACLKKQK